MLRASQVNREFRIPKSGMSTANNPKLTWQRSAGKGDKLNYALSSRGIDTSLDGPLIARCSVSVDITRTQDGRTEYHLCLKLAMDAAYHTTMPLF